MPVYKKSVVAVIRMSDDASKAEAPPPGNGALPISLSRASLMSKTTIAVVSALWVMHL